MFSKEPDDSLKKFINEELVWNQFYRYHILKEEDIVATHDFSSIKKI
jgi:hypothetical protein